MERVGCTQNSDCGTPVYGGNVCKFGNAFRTLTFPVCDNNICQGEALTYEFLQNCANGCSNGSCTNPVCTQNSDCGTDGFTGQAFCSGKNRTQNYQTFICNLPGTLLSSCSNTLIPTLLSTCTYGCSNGACNSSSDECEHDSDCDDDEFCNDDNECENEDDNKGDSAYYCGNGICDKSRGENSDSCPSDCGSNIGQISISQPVFIANGKTSPGMSGLAFLIIFGVLIIIALALVMLFRAR
jgi:hypothetical protein